MGIGNRVRQVEKLQRKRARPGPGDGGVLVMCLCVGSGGGGGRVAQGTVGEAPGREPSLDSEGPCRGTRLVWVQPTVDE